MYHWMIGPASPATIAGMSRIETISIIAATVNMISAPNVLRTAAAAMKHAAQVVPDNVPRDAATNGLQLDSVVHAAYADVALDEIVVRRREQVDQVTGVSFGLDPVVDDPVVGGLALSGPSSAQSDA